MHRETIEWAWDGMVQDMWGTGRTHNHEDRVVSCNVSFSENTSDLYMACNPILPGGGGGASYPEIDFDNLLQYLSTKVFHKWAKF